MISQDDLSLAESQAAQCPLCGLEFECLRWRIVDADQRPDRVVHAKDGSLQRTFCPRCIGPGVERLGSFSVVRRTEDGIQRLQFLFGEDADELEAESGALQQWAEERIDGGCDLVGSRWVQQHNDVAGDIEDTWPGTGQLFDPIAMKPLLSALNANGAAEVAQVLASAPDLARPNIEVFLARLSEKPDARMAVRARYLRFFIAAARSLGLEEATRRTLAEDTRMSALRSLPRELIDRLTAFLECPIGSTANPFSAIYAEALAIVQELEKAGLPGASADVWIHAGEMLQGRPDVQESMPWAVQACALALKAVGSDREPMAYRILLQLSSACDRRKDGNHSDHVERALELAAAACDYARSLPKDEQAAAAMELGLLYTHRPSGDPNSNLALAREALQRARDTALSANLRMMAVYNLALAEVEEETHFEMGIARLQVLAFPETCATFFDNEQQQNLFQSLGVSLARRAAGAAGEPDDLKQAAEFIERALTMARGRDSRHEAGLLASLLAQVQADQWKRHEGDHDLPGIVKLLDEAEAAFDPGKAGTEYARNELRRAKILRDLGEPALVREKVAQALEKACRYLTPESAPDFCRRAQSNLADLRYGEKDFKAAAAAFETACRASENVYRQTESVAQREEEVANNARLYEGLVDSLASQSTVGEDTAWRILEAMEAGRARLTLDLMGLRPLPRFAGIPNELIATEEQLLAELAWTVPGIATDMLRGDPERLRRQRSTQARLRELWAEISQCGEGGARYAALRQMQPPGRAEMAKYAERLGSGVAILSFFVLRDRVLAVWLRDRSAPRVESVALPSKVLRSRWIETFRREVLDSSGDDAPPHEWLALGELLFAPFASDLSHVDLLVLIPHGDLHMLPLHALSLGGEPLIEKVQVVYGPSIGVLASMVKSETESEAFSASHAEDPEHAKEFEEEAAAVAAQLGTQARPQVRTEAVIAASSARVIHLVCHGYFDPDHPLDSGVLLSDGVLRARDWMALSLRSELVTLSACETGRQKVKAGDELTGLARALLQAGSASVLLTLWRVYSDSTAAWMSLFYGYREETRAKAFQLATKQLRAQDPDARAWAPFALTGAL